MGLKFNSSITKKINEAKDLVEQTARNITNSSKKVINNINTKANALELAAKDKNYQNRLKKYNPLFIDEFESDNFFTPNLIRIVDDAVRKGIDVCEGSIGWLSNEKGVEIFHLYDEAILLSNINFVPAPLVDAVYLVDPLNKNIFINSEDFYSYIQQSKIAELQHIAFSLGAKYYKVELVDITDDQSSNRTKSNVKSRGAKLDVDMQAENRSSSSQNSLAEGKFVNSSKPKFPNLKWFSNDSNILRLIEMRCSENYENGILNYKIELSQSSVESISLKMAQNINSVVSGFGIKSNFDKNSMVQKNTKLILYLEF